MSPFDPPLRALRQLDDPALLRVLLWSVLGALGGFVALGLLVYYGVHGWLGWNGWIAGLLGGVGSAVLAHYLFLPVAGGVATLFSDPIAAAVERRFYPDAGPPNPAPLAAQIWDGLALGLRVLLLQVAALLLTPLLPGVSVVLAYAVAAWAIGRGLFVAVAMRHMDRPRALALYRARRGAVVVQGSIAVGASLLPLANLLVPVLAVASMVHLLHDVRSGWPGGSSAGRAGLARSRTV